MANLIGTITSQSGAFFIKNPDGTMTTAKVGDKIYDNQELIPSSSNSPAHKAEVSLADGSPDPITITNQAQTFDVTMLSGEIIEDTIVSNDELDESLLLEAVNNTQDNNTLPTEDENLALEDIENLPAAAAGAEDPTTDGTGTLVARLEDRTGSETNVSTDLRDQTLNSEEVDTGEGIATDIIIDATLTLNDVNVNEGAGTATISGSLNFAPLSPIVITLSNGSTLSFGTDYVPGTFIESTPFEIQGDDVYIDPESYDITGTSFVGGGFNSVSSNTATVSVTDTTDAYRVVLSANATSVTEGSADVTYTVTLQEQTGVDGNGDPVWAEATSNPYGEEITVNMNGGATVTIGANAVSNTFTATVDIDDAIIDQDGTDPEIIEAIASVELTANTNTPESLTADTTDVKVDVTDTTINSTPPEADPVLTNSNLDTDVIPVNYPVDSNEIAFFKKFDIGGELDGDITTEENDSSDPADLGGKDDTTPEANLVFDITSLPNYGTIYIENNGTFTEITDSSVLDNLSTTNNLYWSATHTQVPKDGVQKTLGGDYTNDGIETSWKSSDVNIVTRDENNQDTVITYNESDGIGVAGITAAPNKDFANNQLGFDANTQKSEFIIFDFTKPVTNATIGITHLIRGENGGEVGVFEAFLDGKSLGEFTFSNNANAGADYTLTAQSVGNGNEAGSESGILEIQNLVFDQIKFSAQEYVTQNGTNDSSDYFIGEITYNEVPNAEFNYKVIDEDNNESIEVKVEIVPDTDTDVPQPGTDVNSVPETTDSNINIDEDTSYTLTVDDFGNYSDSDNDPLTSVKIETLPNNGILKLNNNDVNDVINISDIENGNLVFIANQDSDLDSSFTFKVSDGEDWSQNHTATINITAVADVPNVDVTIGSGIQNYYTVLGAYEGEGYNSWENNGDLDSANASFEKYPLGYGVVENNDNQGNQGNQGNEIDNNESILFDLGRDVSSLKVILKSNSTNFFGKYRLYNSNRELVSTEEETFKEESELNHTLDINLESSTFRYIIFNEGYGTGPSKYSNEGFFVNIDEIDGSSNFDETTTYPITFNTSLNDIDGSESLSIQLENIPTGAQFTSDDFTINSDYSITVNSDSISETGTINMTVPKDTDISSFKVTVTATEDNDNSDLAVSIQNDISTLILDDDDTIDLSITDTKTDFKDIENIDLTANGSQEILNLSLDDVIENSDDNHELKITGDRSDKVTLTDDWSANSTKTIDNITYDVYDNDSDNTYKVLIQTDITIDNIS